MDTFTNDGLRFEVDDRGPVDGRVVVLLHGFPNDRTCWDGVSARLTAAGYRTLAPDQRGYSPGARPRRRRDYRLRLLAGDVLALADAAGAARFDLVGHDWGAIVAHCTAARHPARVRSVTALSVPHSGAWLQSMWRSTQLWRSAYMAVNQLPWLPERVLARGGGAGLCRFLVRGGLDPAAARRYAGRRAARRDTLTGPLNWYRAIPFGLRERVPPSPVPTLMVWSDRDVYVTRTTAGLCGRWVTGPYRFEVLAGVSHWIPDQAPDRAAALIAEHLAATAAPTAGA